MKTWRDFPHWATEDESVVLVNADCLALLDSLPRDAAIVSDPPYGMNWNASSNRFCGGSEASKKKRGVGRQYDNGIAGDDKPFNPAPWIEYPEAILFGNNHFAQRLPVGTTLVWIKRKDEAFGSFLSDAELIWKKGGHGVYCKRGPFPQALAHDREHPTQKPVELMEWCLSFVEGRVVIDPYMGSGSTGLACIGMNRHFIGIEIDPAHFATAVRRIQVELSRYRLFEPPPAVRRQQELIA